MTVSFTRLSASTRDLLTVSEAGIMHKCDNCTQHAMHVDAINSNVYVAYEQGSVLLSVADVESFDNEKPFCDVVFQLQCEYSWSVVQLASRPLRPFGAIRRRAASMFSKRRFQHHYVRAHAGSTTVARLNECVYSRFSVHHGSAYVMIHAKAKLGNEYIVLGSVNRFLE